MIIDKINMEFLLDNLDTPNRKMTLGEKIVIINFLDDVWDTCLKSINYYGYIEQTFPVQSALMEFIK